MGLQDKVFDVEADIAEHCPAHTQETFNEIVQALWRFESERDAAEAAFNRVADAAKTFRDLMKFVEKG